MSDPVKLLLKKIYKKNLKNAKVSENLTDIIVVTAEKLNSLSAQQGNPFKQPLGRIPNTGAVKISRRILLWEW